MICEEEPLDAGQIPRPLAAPLRGPGLLPRWEEVHSAQRKTNMDCSRNEGTWISYLGRSPISPPPARFTQPIPDMGIREYSPSAPSIPPGCRANIWKENILIFYPPLAPLVFNFPLLDSSPQNKRANTTEEEVSEDSPSASSVEQTPKKSSPGRHQT